MIEIYTDFTGIEELDKGIIKTLQDRLVNIIETAGTERTGRRLDSISDDDLRTGKYLEVYFPPWIPRERVTATFLGLYEMIKDEKMHTLPLMHEYILYKLIDEELEKCRNGLKSSRVSLPRRDEIVEALDELYEDDETGEGMGEYIVDELEDLDCFWNIYYDDMDCLFLESMTEQDIKNSGLDEILGIF